MGLGTRIRPQMISHSLNPLPTLLLTRANRPPQSVSPQYASRTCSASWRMASIERSTGPMDCAWG